ncbi:MAG: hypothetical protein DRP90_01740 [Planctomycetota bacterium]|nr:MAG: hypothetical protein DRP90_01740 [Planctomycetota bacterium]
MSGIAFGTVISSSSGNCAVAAGPRGAVVIDAGFSSQARFRNALSEIRERFGPVKAVVITHAHRDHVNYSTLKVMSTLNVPFFLSLDTVERLATMPECVEPLKRCWVELYDDQPFQITDFVFRPFPLEHAPDVPNRGFVIEGLGHRIGFATDLRTTEGLAARLADCDLLCIEANHDPELLRLHPNPNSQYHLSNGESARLSSDLAERRALPKFIVLSHISVRRNRPALALGAHMLALNGSAERPGMCAAPPDRPSPLVLLDGEGGVRLES